MILRPGDIVRRPKDDREWRVTDTTALLGLVYIATDDLTDTVEPQHLTLVRRDDFDPTDEQLAAYPWASQARGIAR